MTHINWRVKGFARQEIQEETQLDQERAIQAPGTLGFPSQGFHPQEGLKRGQLSHVHHFCSCFCFYSMKENTKATSENGVALGKKRIERKRGKHSYRSNCTLQTI